MIRLSAGFVSLVICAGLACGQPPPQADARRQEAEPTARTMARAMAARPGARRPLWRRVVARQVTPQPATTRRTAPRLAARISVPTEAEAKKRYPWPRRRAGYESLASRFATPAGFTRVKVKAGSYADWLRHLPLLSPGAKVRSYAGQILAGATAAARAVIDLDVGRRDLQQCMDTVMRLRGEYLWWKKQAGRTKFRYAGGRYFGWSQYARGIRPKRQGRRIVYKGGYRAGYGRQHFRRYLTFMFMMTGTMHNVREPTVKFADLAAGHFFLQPPPQPGYLGHAVIVLDVAKNAAGQVRALIGEGYTPAQDLHVTKAPGGGVWYRLAASNPVQTPQWSAPFQWTQLKRFRY